MLFATYRVTHKTSYCYEGTARGLINELRLTPRVFRDQTVLSHRILTTPETTLHESVDPFGNRVLTAYCAEPVEEFCIFVETVIRLNRLPIERTALGSLYGKEIVQDRAFRDLHYLYIMPTQLCHTTPFLSEWIGDEWDRALDMLSFLETLNKRVYSFFDYQPGVTNVETGTEELGALRMGVCQDYAHWMLAALRMIGVPCRYVSGYLFSDPHPEEQAYVGGQAMHAWVDVLVAKDVWLGFDPTNQCMAGERHIYLGVGRDYEDITPIKGVYQGALKSMALDLGIYRL